METNTEIRLAAYDGISWSPTLTRIHTVIGSGVFQLAFDAGSGEGLLITSSQAATGQSVRAKRFQQSETPAMIAATPDLVVVPASPGRHFFPQITSLDGGRWLALWESETYGGWADGMELESACFQ